MTASESCLYVGKPAEPRPAAGTKGVLIRALDGGIMFRVYNNAGQFTDYEIRHNKLGVTIDADALAAFDYRQRAESHFPLPISPFRSGDGDGAIPDTGTPRRLVDSCTACRLTILRCTPSSVRSAANRKILHSEFTEYMSH